MDPSMKLFEYNDKSLLASIPTMLAFQKVMFIASDSSSWSIVTETNAVVLLSFMTATRYTHITALRSPTLTPYTGLEVGDCVPWQRRIQA